jgi:hypothetical protein
LISSVTAYVRFFKESYYRNIIGYIFEAKPSSIHIAAAKISSKTRD